MYDLDMQQIVDFKLKPWIELLMQLKITLGDQDEGDQNENELDDSSSNSEEKQGVVWCPQVYQK